MFWAVAMNRREKTRASAEVQRAVSRFTDLGIVDVRLVLSPYTYISCVITAEPVNVDVKPVSNCFRVVVCLNSSLEKFSWLVQR